MAALEFIRAYLNDLLCTTEASLEDHLGKLRMILTRLRDGGLQVNVCKSSFCAIEMEYLGYILMCNGIKSQQKKVQVILAITPQNKAKTSVNSWVRSSISEIFGKDAAKCLPHSPL